MNVGFIGLGNMGLPMAENLLRTCRSAGHALVVWSRTRAKAEALAQRGAQLADSIPALVQRVDVVCACLADVAASREVFLGPSGAIAAARAGQVLVDHATVDIATTLACHGEAERRGVAFLDAPISGGPEGARAASLSIMAGGTADAFARAKPALDAMGQTVMHMGPHGTGTATKLANQLLVGVQSLAAAEAMCLARAAGVDLAKLFEVLKKSWGASRMLERNAPRIIARDFGPSAAPVRNLDKDLGIILGLAAEQGLRLPVAEAAGEFFRALNHAGWGERDIAAVAQRIEEGL